MEVTETASETSTKLGFDNRTTQTSKQTKCPWAWKQYPFQDTQSILRRLVVIRLSNTHSGSIMENLDLYETLEIEP